MSLSVIIHTPLPDGTEVARLSIGQIGSPPLSLGPRHEESHSFLRVGWHDPEDGTGKPLEVPATALVPYAHVTLESSQHTIFRGFLAEVTHRAGHVVGLHAAHYDYLDVWASELPAPPPREDVTPR